MAFFVVVGGPPLTGFARALGAGDLVYGVIMAMPVAGGIVQVFASYFLESTGKRKFIFLFFGFIHRFLWIPIALIPLFVPPSHNAFRIWAVTILITISSTANSIVGVAFSSWMGALVPMETRGRFFSKRTMICTITGAIAGMGAGKLLDLMPGFNGYAIVFVTVALFGAADIFCFIWVKDPPMERKTEKLPFLKLLHLPFTNKNYIKLIVFVSVWCFGVNLAGPFFNVYMLEYLNMDFFTISIFCQLLGNVSTIIFIRSWGRVVDLNGNKPVLALCCSILIILPLMWIFTTPQNYYVVLLINFLAGICWPGYEMTTMNMSIWLAPEENRSIYIACYTLVTSSIGVAIAYVCGGAFLEFVRPFFESMSITFVMGQKLSGYHALFILSGLIRLFALIFLLPRVNEDNSRPPLEIVKNITSAVRNKFLAG